MEAQAPAASEDAVVGLHQFRERRPRGLAQRPDREAGRPHARRLDVTTCAGQALSGRWVESQLTGQAVVCRGRSVGGVRAWVWVADVHVAGTTTGGSPAGRGAATHRAGRRRAGRARPVGPQRPQVGQRGRERAYRARATAPSPVPHTTYAGMATQKKAAGSPVSDDHVPLSVSAVSCTVPMPK